jgi:hypothetical protein
MTPNRGDGLEGRIRDMTRLFLRIISRKISVCHGGHHQHARSNRRKRFAIVALKASRGAHIVRFPRFSLSQEVVSFKPNKELFPKSDYEFFERREPKVFQSASRYQAGDVPQPAYARATARSPLTGGAL